MGVAEGGAAGKADVLSRVAAAHERLRARGEVQFDFQAMPPHHPPPWLEPLLKLLAALAPLLKWAFWGALAAGGGLILFFIARELFGLGLPRAKRKAKAAPHDLEWRPEPRKARALLNDADALAAEGRFEEAAHLLLFRSIEDIEERRRGVVKPALTSRDIAALRELPPAARPAFAAIAAAVERSLFGGLRLDAEGFAECRRAYEDFALPGAWA